MSEENVEIVRRLYARLEQGDMNTQEFFDPEIEHLRIGSELPGINGVWRGLDEFAEAMASYLDALADLRVRAERIIDLGDDRVLVLARQTARGKTSDLPFDHEFGEVLTLREGKILRYASYWDPAEAFEAVGVEE